MKKVTFKRSINRHYVQRACKKTVGEQIAIKAALFCGRVCKNGTRFAVRFISFTINTVVRFLGSPKKIIQGHGNWFLFVVQIMLFIRGIPYKPTDKTDVSYAKQFFAAMKLFNFSLTVISKLALFTH